MSVVSSFRSTPALYSWHHWVGMWGAVCHLPLFSPVRDRAALTSSACGFFPPPPHIFMLRTVSPHLEEEGGLL